MEDIEYATRLREIENDFEVAKRKLIIEYAKSKEIFKKGDVITNGITTILIDRITAYKTYGMPLPVYNGSELKKDLTPKKNGDRGSIYGNEKATLLRNG